MTGDGVNAPVDCTLSYLRVRGKRRADRRLDRARHGPVHGQRLLSGGQAERLGTILDATASVACSG
jgi:hypothetical protein